MRTFLMTACLAGLLVGCGSESGTIDLSHVALEPDLTIIASPTQTIHTNTIWTADIGIKNEGAINAKAFDVRLQMGHSIGVASVPTGLAASQATVVHITMAGINHAGLRTGQATVDSHNTVMESNETNNVGNFSVNVSGPTLMANESSNTLVVDG